MSELTVFTNNGIVFFIRRVEKYISDLDVWTLTRRRDGTFRCRTPEEGGDINLSLADALAVLVPSGGQPRDSWRQIVEFKNPKEQDVRDCWYGPVSEVLIEEVILPDYVRIDRSTDSVVYLEETFSHLGAKTGFIKAVRTLPDAFQVTFFMVGLGKKEFVVGKHDSLRDRVPSPFGDRLATLFGLEGANEASVQALDPFGSHEVLFV